MRIMSLIGTQGYDGIRDSVIDAIRRANNTLNDWYFHKNKRDDAQDFIQVRSMFRTWMYKCVEAKVGYGTLKNVELSLSINHDALIICKVTASSRNSLRTRNTGTIVDILNDIFEKLDYNSIKDKEGVQRTTSPVIEGESHISFGIDYNKLQTIKFN